MYHATVMQRPEEEDDGARRERDRANGASNTRPYSARSPTQTDFHAPYSPTNGIHPRPQFNNPYHPPTPAPLPMPTAAPVSGPPASPRTGTAHAAYQSDYQPATRDKPNSNYYDPTSDSSDRRPSEGAGRNEGVTSQVRHGRKISARSLTPSSIDARVLCLRARFGRATKILQRSIYLSGCRHIPSAISHLPFAPARSRILNITIAQDVSDHVAKYPT